MRRRRSAQRLSFLSSLPAYWGGKRKLAGVIFREIDRVVPRGTWQSLVFLDAFMGGCSIALYAKAMGFGRVIGTDIASRSLVIGEALLSNCRARLTRHDLLRVLARKQDVKGFALRNFVPGVFTEGQARVIDSALAVAALSGDKAKQALLRLLAIRVALLAHPYSLIRKGAIQHLSTGEYERLGTRAATNYVSGLRLTTLRGLESIAAKINAGVFEGQGEVRQMDIVESIGSIEADVMYADPPYASTFAYERQYRFLDQLLGDEQREVSPFSAKGGSRQLDVLLDRARHIPLWLLSFGQETTTITELESKMADFGRETKAISIPYRRLPALTGKAKQELSREFLVIGIDPEAAFFKKRGDA